MAFSLYIDLQKADAGGKPPAPPKPAGAKASKSPTGDDRQSWGQPVDHYTKARYPESPSNKIGETDKSWVLPKGVAPTFGNKAESPEEKPSEDGKPAEAGGTSKRDTIISTSDPVHVEAAPPSSASPKSAEQGLLGGGKQDPKLTIKDAKAPVMDSKDHSALAAEATRQGNPALAAKHGKLSQAKATLESADPEDGAIPDDSAAINSAVHKEDDKDAKAAKQANAAAAKDGVVKDPNAAVNSAIHKDKEESSNKIADDTAKEFKASQKEKAKDGATKDDSAAINAAAHKDKEGKVKEDNKEADKASKEFKEKQKAKSKDDAVKDDSAVNAAAAKDLHKERLAKEKADKKAKVDEVKAKEKAKKDEETKVKAEQKKKDDAATKQKETDKKKLDKQRASKDEQVAKEAEKEYKGQQQEKARKRRVPSNPVEMAEHSAHTNSANEARAKAVKLVQAGVVDGQQKEVLGQVVRAIKQHSDQKHPPDAREKKELNALVSHVNKMHEANAKEEASKKKFQDGQKKEHQNKIKEEAKVAEKKAKEEAKAGQLAEKQKKQDGKIVESNTTGPQAKKPKSAMGAFHSGRSAGQQADTAATSDSAGGLGSQTLNGITNGAASAGHKLLSGKKGEEKKTYRNGNVYKQSSMTKSLYIDLSKAGSGPVGNDPEEDGFEVGVTGEDIVSPTDNEGDTVDKSLAILQAKARELTRPSLRYINELPHKDLIKVAKSVTLEVQSKLDFLRKAYT